MTRKPDLLRRLARGVDRDLSIDWTAFREGYDQKNANAVQLRADNIILGYRLKAVTRYMLDGDRLGFFESCFHAALTFHLCNQLIKSGMPHDPNMYSIANARGFYEALLTFSPAGVRDVAMAMPDEMRDQDDATQFFFVAALMQIALDARAGLEDTLAMFRDHAEENADAELELGLCESLRDKDAPRFTESMHAYLDRRLAQIENSDDDVNPGEEYISFEGLAVRRLAANLGMEVQIRHQLTPTELQESYPDPSTLSRGDVPPFPSEAQNAAFWSDWESVESW